MTSPALATVTGLAITSVEISPSTVTLGSDHVDITIAYAGAAGTGDVYFVADTVKWDSVCYNEGQYGHFCSWNVTGKGCDGHNCKKLTCGFKSSFMNIPADSDCLPTGCQQEARQLAHIASPSGSFTFTIPIAGIELGTYSITVGAWSETSFGTLKKISGPDGYCRSTLTVMPKITDLAITSVEVSPSTVTLDSEQADLTVHYDGANGVGDVYFVADTVKWDTSVCVDEGQYGYFCSWDTTGLGCDGHNCNKLTCGFKNPFMNIPADSDCLPIGCRQEARQLAHIASPSGSFTFSLPIAGMEPGDYSITVGAWSETSPGILNKLSGPEGYCRSALTVLRKMEVDVNYPGEAEASNFMLNSLDNYLLNRPFPGAEGLQELLNTYKDPSAARITVTDSQTGEQLKDITVTASGQYEYPERPEGPSISAASSLSAMSSGFRQYYDYYPIDLNLPFPFLGLAYPDSPLKNAEYYYYPQQFENVVVSSSPFDFPIYYDDHNYGNFEFYLDLYKEGYAPVSSSYPFEVVQNKLEIQLHPTGFPDQEAAFAPENIRLTISPQSEVSGTTVSCNVVIYYSDRGYGDWAPWDFGIWPPERWAFFQVTNVQNNVENDLTFNLAGESAYWYSTLFPRETYGYYESDGQGLFFARAFCQNPEGTGDVATTSFFIPKLRVDFEGSPSTFAGTYFPLKYRATHLAGKETSCGLSFDGSQYKELPEVPSGVQQTELIPVEPGHHSASMWCSDDLIEGWGYFEFDVTEPPSSVCGNNACEPGETESSCPQDCLATQFDKLDTSPTMCWNDTCNFDSHPAGFKIDNRYITDDGNIVTVEYNNWQEGIPFMTSSLAGSWTNKQQWLGLQKRINATGLGKVQVYARINAPNTNWWLMLKNSNGDAVYTSKFTPTPEWSDWKRLDLSPDANNTLRLTLSGLDGVSGQKGIKVQYLVIDPDLDFPIFAVPVNYHLTDPHAISDSRFESRVNTNITNLFVTKVWNKLPDLKDTPPSRIKPIPLSTNCEVIVDPVNAANKNDLNEIDSCVKNTEFKLRNAPNLPVKGRIVGLDGRDNWETSKEEDIGGWTNLNSFRVFVDYDGGPKGDYSNSNYMQSTAGTIVMHEFGHTWGLLEEYMTNVTYVLGIPIERKTGCSSPNNCTHICVFGTSPDKCAGNPIVFDDLNSDGFPNEITGYRGIPINPNGTCIMGMEGVPDQTSGAFMSYTTAQKEFDEADLRHIDKTFWNELSASSNHSIMMFLEFRISENGTFSLLSSGMKDGYFASPIDAEPSNQTYLLRVYSANGTLLYNQTFKPEFLAFGFEVQPTEIIDTLAIPYLEDAAAFRIEKLDSTPVFAINVPETFCNKNGICDASENYLSCPSDCQSGSKDGHCDGIKDGIADPDCSAWQDPDYSCNNNSVCEPNKNENALTCQSDCQLWAQDGVCPVFTDLKDGHCDPDCGSKDLDCAGQTGWSVFTAKTAFSLNLGDTEAVPVQLTNLDQQENRTFELSVAGLDPSIYNLSFNMVIIPAGETGVVALALAPSSCLLTPTTYNFSIFVTSEGETRQLNASLEIKPTRKVSLSAQPDGQELGFAENTSYSLKIGNLGNIDDLYRLSVSAYPEGPKFDYPQLMDVPACADKTVNLTVLPTGCSAKPNNYTISVSLVSQSDPQTYASGVTVLGTVPEVSRISSFLAPVWQQAYPGQIVGYLLSLKNEGNVDQNLTIAMTYPDLPTSVFWTWTRNMTGGISPVQHFDFLEACGEVSLTLNATVSKEWSGFNETVYQFVANTEFSGQNLTATASLQVNATFNSSMFYKIETADYLLDRLDQLKQQDKISKQDYNSLRKQYARLKELGENAIYGKIPSKNARDKDDEDEKETEKELGLNKDEMEVSQDLEKEYSNDFQNHAPLKHLKRDVLLTYLIDKQLLLKQNLSEKARCRLPRQKYCDYSWTNEFLLYNKYIRGSDFRAIKEFLEQQKLDMTQELAGSTCKEKQKQAASKPINKGTALLASLNPSIGTNLKGFLKENVKIWQISASYLAANSVLSHCNRSWDNER